MKSKEKYLYGQLVTLHREQVRAIDKHVNGNLGSWGKSRMQSRIKRCAKIAYQISQLKYKQFGHSAAAIESFRADRDEIQSWGDLSASDFQTMESVLEDLIMNVIDKFEPDLAQKKLRREEVESLYEQTKSNKEKENSSFGEGLVGVIFLAWLGWVIFAPSDKTSSSSEIHTPVNSHATYVRPHKNIKKKHNGITAPVSSKQVATAQNFLKKLGYYDGKIDGKDGRRTWFAITAFQRQHGMAVDGVISNGLIHALKAAAQ